VNISKVKLEELFGVELRACSQYWIHALVTDRVMPAWRD